MKEYGGSRGVSPHLILNLGSRWSRFAEIVSQPLYSQKKKHRCPFNRSFRGPHSRSGRFGEEKKFSSGGTEGRKIEQIVGVSTEIRNDSSGRESLMGLLLRMHEQFFCLSICYLNCAEVLALISLFGLSWIRNRILYYGALFTCGNFLKFPSFFLLYKQ